MARVCEFCGKKTIFGKRISHAHNVSSRTFLPNIQKLRIRLEGGGSRRAKVCTRCVRSGSIQKAVR